MSELAPSRQGQDHVRRRNLSAILRSVHRQRATTRAELTRLTGLSRTSVGTLVAELERESCRILQNDSQCYAL